VFSIISEFVNLLSNGFGEVDEMQFLGLAGIGVVLQFLGDERGTYWGQFQHQVDDNAQLWAALLLKRVVIEEQSHDSFWPNFGHPLAWDCQHIQHGMEGVRQWPFQLVGKFDGSEDPPSLSFDLGDEFVKDGLENGYEGWECIGGHVGAESDDTDEVAHEFLGFCLVALVEFVHH
jgi:hypothetical protein